MESEFLSEMRERLVKEFLDMLILMKLRQNTMSGYEIVKFIPKRFNLLISSGTMYYTLQCLERDGFIESTKGRRSRTYDLANQGEERVKMFLQSKNKILGLVVDLFMSS